MNFLQLKYIITIMEEGGISSAARKLYVSQPSLSQMLRSVEKELGVELIDRSSTKISPTYAGELFYQQSKLILMNYDNLIHTMQEISGQERSRLKLGIPVSRGTYILPRLLTALQQEFPLVQIETSEGSALILEDQLCNGEIDLAFSHYYQRNPNLIYIPIVTEEWLLALPSSHPLSASAQHIANWQKRAPIQLSLLKDTPFILLKHGHSARQITDKLFELAHFVPQVILETHSNAIAHSIAISGLGATVLPEHEVRFHLSEATGCYFSIDQRQYNRKLCLCYHKEFFLSPQLKLILPRIIQIVSEIYIESDKKWSAL